ncbi:MAG: 3-methyladenine glycosylase/8-oxoguanine glycosylase [Verrucomicrobiales bacterium]|nr:3-methyladenine glycosylase/8-oxoguanine glycosylase [Verrucomicrobiales bacterium]
MKFQRHLVLGEMKLGAGLEWREEGAGWLFLRLARGVAYWLGKNLAEEIHSDGVLVVPPDVQGVIRVSQLGTAQLHYFHFCPELVTAFLTVSEEHYLDKVATRAGSKIRIVAPDEPLAQIFRLMVESGEGESTFVRRTQMMNIAALAFSEEMEKHKGPTIFSGSAEQRFKDLIEQMPDGELVKQSPDQLALLCGCSTRHLSRMFRKHFGSTMRTRQTELRLLKARQLLLETDAKITHVAFESGYRHLGLFNQMFKKYLGVTPSEWREAQWKKAGGRNLLQKVTMVLLILLLMPR